MHSPNHQPRPGKAIEAIQPLLSWFIPFCFTLLTGLLLQPLHAQEKEWSDAVNDWDTSERINRHENSNDPRQEKASRSSNLDLESSSAMTPRQLSSSETVDQTPWEIGRVMTELQDGQSMPGASYDQPWWTSHVSRTVQPGAQVIEVNMGDLMMMAIQHSAKISVARDLPLIRETAITGAEASFDWSKFVDARWQDSSEPVGSSLTVGGTGTRFREHNFSVDAGLRRKLFSGGELNMYQRAGHRNNNSTFFDPNDQATSRIVLGFTQPLMRGRGFEYNTSLILLAQIDTGSAANEFHRQLQSHLMEVNRSYWALYLERVNLAQKVKLYLKTRAVAEQLNSRSEIDAQQTQIISANAALESRKSDLIRSRSAVKNAETRLRALLNAPMLSGDSDQYEIIPAEHPVDMPVNVNVANEFQIALQNRPEISAAMKQIRAACVRLQMSDHEILPTLNLLTEAYISGLRGESDIGNAWVDQFREGEPSYSVGFQYEVPLGRRAAFSNQRRRQVEVHQLREQYRATMELVRAEVEIAVRELVTSHQELQAKNRTRLAGEAEVRSLEIRWQQLGDRGGTGGLLLESLLRAQERLTGFEFEYAKTQITYNLAMINLRHANGTLYQSQAHDPSMTGPQFLDSFQNNDVIGYQPASPAMQNQTTNQFHQHPQQNYDCAVPSYDLPQDRVYNNGQPLQVHPNNPNQYVPIEQQMNRPMPPAIQTPKKKAPSDDEPIIYYQRQPDQQIQPFSRNQRSAQPNNDAYGYQQPRQPEGYQTTQSGISLPPHMRRPVQSDWQRQPMQQARNQDTDLPMNGQHSGMQELYRNPLMNGQAYGLSYQEMVDDQPQMRPASQRQAQMRQNDWRTQLR